jgi:toxin FitB
VIVLDSNVISELMRSRPSEAVVGWMRAQTPSRLGTTAVNVAEIRYGIARLPRGRRQAGLRAAADQVFDTFADKVLPFDGGAARHYVDIVVERERAGHPISGFVAQIAAMCRAHSATLATRDIDDFGPLGLDVVNPWRAEMH